MQSTFFKKLLIFTVFYEVKTPVYLIAEDIHCVNRSISKSQSFYTDMVRESIVLYGSGEYQLADPVVLPLAERAQKMAERRRVAEADFQHWFGKAMILKKGFALHFQEGDYSEAAFILHQIVERLCGAVIAFIHSNVKMNAIGTVHMKWTKEAEVPSANAVIAFC
ncbi:hypothetical protein CBF23_002510 [Marinomonas agarivorans]|nr:hypothetical protein CBF23_002510 [Marinomonas agarivorans]